MGTTGPGPAGTGRVPTEQLKRMDEEIKDAIARRGTRHASALLPEVEAVMRRYGVLEPDTEGLIQWIDKEIAELEAAQAD
jgi:hypothetical protein